MDINQLSHDIVNMSEMERQQLLLEMGKAFQQAGLIHTPSDGQADLMAYMTRQPVALRGLRLLGVHTVECVRVKHPTKKIEVEIPKADYNAEVHGPIIRTKTIAAAVVAAPVEEDTDADDSDEDEDDEDDEESVNAKPLRTRKRK